MKIVRKDDKSINIAEGANVQNSFNSERTFIKVVFGSSSRWFKRTFCKNRYYSNFQRKLDIQVEGKLESFKHSKKYIPDVFLELDDSKERLRYLSDPVLFFNKVIYDLERLDLSYFNRVFEKMGFPIVEIFLPREKFQNVNIGNVSQKSEQLLEVLANLKSNLPTRDEWDAKKDNVGEEASKLIIKEWATIDRVNWLIGGFEKLLELTSQKRFILFTEKAGQGKTNLVCDFVENYIKKKELLGTFLTGNEFNNLSRESIETVIVNEVLGSESGVTFSEFLEDIKVLCIIKNCPFTIIIDGINENTDVDKFNNELYAFVNRVIKYDFLRLVITCRSEYFETRFSKFCKPSFESNMLLYDNYLNQYRAHKGLAKHLETRLIQSYFGFFSVKNTVFKNVQHQIVNDFLLLRIFCEVYGERSNPNTPKEQVYNIFKDDLFKSYYDYKSTQLNIDPKFSSYDFKNVFRTVFEYMIENNQFINIPFTALDNLDRQLLDNIINEDILLRKDLVLDASSVFGNVEVLNFTFDEFRDYLLVDYIVNSDYDVAKFLQSLKYANYCKRQNTELGVRGLAPMKYNTILEGVEKYLFMKSRRTLYRGKLQFLEQLERYNDLFIDNIFSVNDEFITDNDIRKVTELFFISKENAHLVIQYLMFRHMTSHYQNLNISLLFSIISGLEEGSYNEYINSYFRARKKDYYSELEGIILDLTRRLTELISCRDFDEESELHNVMELLVLLLGVDGNGYGDVSSQTIELFNMYLLKYPSYSKSLLIKYLDVKNPRIQVQIWRLLSNYAKGSKNIDSSFIEMCFSAYENTWDERVKKAVFNLLKCCQKVEPSLFVGNEMNRLELIKEEQEIDYDKLFVELQNDLIRFKRS